MRRLPVCILPVVLLLMTLLFVCPVAGADMPEVRTAPKIDYYSIIRDNSGRPMADIIRDANGCRQRNRIDSAAAFYYTVARQYSEELPVRDIRRCAIASVNLGYILLGWEMNPTAAYPWLMKADSISKLHGFNDIRTSVTSNLGRMYLDYNNYPKAAQYLQQALSEVMVQKTDRYFGMSLVDFTAAALFGQEQLLRGKFAEEVIGYDLDGNMPLARYARSLQRAIARFKANDTAGAARIMMESRQWIDIDSERDLYYVMHAIITGKFLIAAGNYQQAAAILKDEVASAQAEGYYNLLEKCYSMLIECARHDGDNQAAERYRYQALEIRDSLFSAARFDAVKDFEKSTAIEELRGQGEADIRATRRRFITVTVCCVALLILAFLIWLYAGRRRKNKVTPASASTRIPRPDETPDETTRLLWERISRLVEESDAVFSPDFSIETLAESVGSRPKAVSQAINQVGGKNFNTFIGAVRVRKACELLTDPKKMKTITIESVAESVGYKSRTYFSKVFKDITGQTPSQFARNASNNPPAAE